MARSRSWTRKHMSLMASAMGWHGSAHPGANASGPTAGHCFDVAVEADAFHSLHVMAAKERTLPAAKAVEGHRYRDRNVDTNHAHLDLVSKGARRVSVAGEDAHTVAILVIVHQVQSLLKAGHVQYREDRTKNLLAIDAHLRRDVIEDAWRQEKAITFRQRLLSVRIDQKFGTLFHPQFDIAGHFVAVHAGDERTHLGAGLGPIGDLELGHALAHAREQGFSGAFAHRDSDRDRHAALACGTEGRAG